MTVRATWSLWVCVALAAVCGSRPTQALDAYGPLQVTGNVQSQTLLRSRRPDNWTFVQNRNTLRLRLDFDWMKNGRLLDHLDVPWVKDSTLYLLYRGIYDSVYDVAPGGNLRDIDNNPAGSINSLSHQRRDALKFQNDLREAYVDLDFRDIPLSLRLGKQQVVWGETDNFRMLDRANPLDLTWHQVYESWDDLRRPLWMIKALWRVGELGPLSDAFIETYWNPGDWYPAKQGFLPDYPWGIPSTDPLAPLFSALHAKSLAFGTTAFNQGNYTRDPADNSQVGVRFSAVIPPGVQFTLNYFYQRWAGDDGTNSAPFAAVTNLAESNALVTRHQVPIEFIAPYVHAVGASLNYSEDTYTETVYRLETVYDFGIPFSDRDKPSPFFQQQFGANVYGVTDRNMWKGMVAFDRPTWIHALNRKNTFFLSGQYFWHYLDKKPSLIGGLDPTGQDRDDVRRWEMLFTLLATTYYVNGTVVPTLVYAVDPVNTWNMYVGWSVDYYVTNQFIVRLGQNYFLAAGAGSVPAFETWSLGGLNRGRSETLLRLTYQF